MDNNNVIKQANIIVENFIARTKNKKKDTVFSKNTVLKHVYIKIIIGLILLSFGLSMLYFALWLITS